MDTARPSATERAMVVGGGIAGIACARELAAAGLPYLVWDRARRVGGRMASRTIDNRAVDIGASYFTASDPAFRPVVEDWCHRGLARPWTDTFAVAGPEGITGTTTGPLRFGAAGGLRSLVVDLAEGLYVERGAEVESVTAPRGRLAVDGMPAAAVALAMPDPQAADLIGSDLRVEEGLVAGREWSPSLTLYAGWDRRCWPQIDGVFVNGSPLVAWIADDGQRRGDGAPVLVAHSTPELADSVLDDPGAGLDLLLMAVCGVLGIEREPDWAGVRRWSLSRPEDPHPQSCHLGASGVGLCGDGWGGQPRVEAAYLSGRALGRELVARLTA